MNPSGGLLQALGAVGIGLWMVVLLAIVGIGAFALRAEYRDWRRRGEGRAWVRLRLALLPVAAISLLLPWLALPRVSGMEGLAVLYLILLVLAPALFFALHLLLGRLLSPPLPAGRSAQLAATGLLGLVAVPMAINAAAPTIWSLTRGVEASLADTAADAPGRHRIADRRHFVADGAGEFVSFHVAAPAGVRTLRATLQAAAIPPLDLSGPQTRWSCRADQDLHLLLPAGGEAATLEIVWSDGGLPRRSRWTLTPVSGPPLPFAVAWSDDGGIALPVRLPKSAVDVAFADRDGQPDWNSAVAMTGQPGESLGDFGCMKTAYRYPRPLQALRLVLARPGGSASAAVAVFQRPAAAGTTAAADERR